VIYTLPQKHVNYLLINNETYNKKCQIIFIGLITYNWQKLIIGVMCKQSVYNSCCQMESRKFSDVPRPATTPRNGNTRRKHNANKCKYHTSSNDQFDHTR